MRLILKEIIKKYKNKNVFVVGGGPSVSKEQLDYISNKETIAINSSCKYVENVGMVYWTDCNWPFSHEDFLMNTEAYKLNARLSAENHIEKELLGTHGETVLKLDTSIGYSEDINKVNGNNSGTQLVNFLCNVPVKKIFLLGFDMNVVEGKRHWHEGYNLQYTNNIYRDLFIPSFEGIMPLVRKSGVEVYNCNPASSLNCFKKIHWSEIKDYE